MRGDQETIRALFQDLPAMVYMQTHLVRYVSVAVGRTTSRVSGESPCGKFLEYAAIVAEDVTHFVSDDIVCSKMPFCQHIDQRDHIVPLAQFCLHKKGHGQGRKTVQRTAVLYTCIH
jgi:hypothetical protein